MTEEAKAIIMEVEAELNKVGSEKLYRALFDAFDRALKLDL